MKDFQLWIQRQCITNPSLLEILEKLAKEKLSIFLSVRPNYFKLIFPYKEVANVIPPSEVKWLKPDFVIIVWLIRLSNNLG